MSINTNRKAGQSTGLDAGSTAGAAINIGILSLEDVDYLAAVRPIDDRVRVPIHGDWSDPVTWHVGILLWANAAVMAGHPGEEAIAAVRRWAESYATRGGDAANRAMATGGWRACEWLERKAQQ